MTDFKTVNFSEIVCEAVDRAQLNGLDDGNLERLASAYDEILTERHLKDSILVASEIVNTNIQTLVSYYDPDTLNLETKVYLIEGEPV